MQKYQTIKKLGEGAFGNVEKAQNIQTKQIVAIKKLKKKYGTWEECLQLSQVKALRKISHPNIIKLKQLVRVMNDAYLIFQYIQKDLQKLITQRKQKGKCLQQYQIRTITKQVTEALLCTHKQGFFHRDLKPQNILISQQNNEMSIKVIDFGIAKQIRSMPPFTEYVSTRWYRAPELLFRFPTYSAPVDIFALGCLVAEMYLKKPIFMGNSQMDQISKICSVIGSPTLQNWPQGHKHAIKKGINYPQFNQIQLNLTLNQCPKDAVDFIKECLKWDPSKRMTAGQLINHPFVCNIQQYVGNKKNSINFKSSMNANLSNNGNHVSVVKNYDTPVKIHKNINNLDKDDQFQQLLNSFDTKLKSTKNLSNEQQQQEDKDDW